MKWFKHWSTSTSDPDLMESEVRFKAAGPYVFWRTLEVLSKEDATENALNINFKVFKTFFPSTSANKLKEILEYFDKKSRIFVNYEDENILIFCNKLAVLSSDYNAKVRSLSVKSQESVSNLSVLEVEGDLEGDLEEEHNRRGMQGRTY